MIVADASAIISLVAVETLSLVLGEFDVHTTTTVIEELRSTGAYDDQHGVAARAALKDRDGFTVHRVNEGFEESSRIDAGEGSCAILARELDADFLLTDDLRALPELQRLVPCEVAISPIVLRALVDGGIIDPEDARNRVETLAAARGWLGAPIYRRAMALFDDVEQT